MEIKLQERRNGLIKRYDKLTGYKTIAANEYGMTASNFYVQLKRVKTDETMDRLEKSIEEAEKFAKQDLERKLKNIGV